MLNAMMAEEGKPVVSSSFLSIHCTKHNDIFNYCFRFFHTMFGVSLKTILPCFSYIHDSSSRKDVNHMFTCFLKRSSHFFGINTIDDIAFRFFTKHFGIFHRPKCIAIILNAIYDPGLVSAKIVLNKIKLYYAALFFYL